MSFFFFFQIVHIYFIILIILANHLFTCLIFSDQQAGLYFVFERRMCEEFGTLGLKGKTLLTLKKIILFLTYLHLWFVLEMFFFVVFLFFPFMLGKCVTSHCQIQRESCNVILLHKSRCFLVSSERFYPNNLKFNSITALFIWDA